MHTRMGAKMVPTTEEKSFAHLEEMLRSSICKVCIERTAKGICGLNDDQDCALFLHFPRMVRAISLVDSDQIVDYVDSIRKHVCSECPGQGEDGICLDRSQVRCVLDRYLPLIVDIIEEFQGIRLTGRNNNVEL